MQLAIRAAAALALVAFVLACRDGASAGPVPERSTPPSTPLPETPQPAAEPTHAVDAVPGKKAGATPAPAAAPEAPHPVTVQRSRTMMGTIIQMTSLGVPEAQAGPMLDAALDEMKRLEGVLSEWLPQSDVSRVNAAAGDHPVQVGPDMLENVKVGLEVARWSDGAFDLSWAALRGLYLFQPGQERVPTDAELKERLKFVGYKDILLDEQKSTVFLRRKGMALGLGGIAKGYALEKAANLLLARGIDNYMIFGGGQVLVHGMKGDRPWRVGVQHPRLNDYFGFVEATSGSIATSGDYEHAFMRDGVRWHHIIDLKTGRPVAHTASVTVVSESAFYADAIDTALFIMGPKKALAKLATAPGPKADLLIVGSDMRLYMSPGMQQRLITKAKLVDGKLPLSEDALH